MKEKLEAVLQKIKTTTQGLSKKTKRIIIVGIAVSVIASIGIAFALNNKPYATLFYNLTTEEASEIMGKLQEQGVSYKYEDGGTILVPEAEAEQLKAQLVYEGYPKSGLTYDYYLSQIDLTTSESEKEQYALMDAQEGLASTIRLFPNVETVNVLIALGEDRKYVLDSENMAKATASVTVVTKNGEPLEEDAVRAIQRLVSTSIKDMEFDSVAVICNGKDVTVSEETSQIDANELKFQVEQVIDEKIRDKIMTVLLPIYGEGHVEVSVNSEVDINKKIREMINYSPENAQNNTGVISSQTATQEIAGEEGVASGVPGTETNADIPVYTTIETNGTETYVLSDGGAEYLVDQIKEQEQVDAADLMDLTVAVIIDGEDVGGVTEENLRSLVAKAAGITAAEQDEKIEIVSVPFFSENVTPVENEESDGFGVTQEQIRAVLPWIIIASAALLILVLILLLLLKRRKKKRLQFEEALRQQELMAATDAIRMPNGSLSPEIQEQVSNLDMVSGLLDIKNERSMELKNKIRDMAEESPEISAQTLRAWLRGGNQDG